MENLKRKLLSTEIGILLGVCAVPVNAWTIYWTLDLVPSWIRANTLWGFIGLLSYPLAFALFEILGIFLPLVALRFFIPEGWGGERFTTFGFLYVVQFSTFVLLLQFIDSLFWQKRLLLIAFAGGLIFIFLLVHFVSLVNKISTAVSNRLMVLGYFFLTFNLLALIIVIIRNVS